MEIKLIKKKVPIFCYASTDVSNQQNYENYNLKISIFQ